MENSNNQNDEIRGNENNSNVYDIPIPCNCISCISEIIISLLRSANAPNEIIMIVQALLLLIDRRQENEELPCPPYSPNIENNLSNDPPEYTN